MCTLPTIAAAVLAAAGLVACVDRPGPFAPANASIHVSVSGHPADSNIVITTYLRDRSPPYNRRTTRIPVGGSVLEKGLGAGFDIDVGVDTLTLIPDRCTVVEMTTAAIPAFGATRVTVHTSAGRTDSVGIVLQCRNAVIALDVSGLPAGDTANVAVRNGLMDYRVDAPNGTTLLPVIPSAMVQIDPPPTPGRDGYLYVAPFQTVAVSSRQTTTVQVIYRAPANACPATQPLAWYRMAGDAADSSGSAIHGSVQGAAPVPDRNGVANAALAFDGQDDLIDLGNRFDSLSPPFSVAAWIYYSVAGSGQFRSIFASDDQPGSYFGLWFMVSPTGHLSISYGDGGRTSTQFRRTAETVGPIPSDRWLHVAATVRGPTDMTLYVDGVPVSSALSGTGGAMAHSPAPARIGSFQLVAANRPWLGPLDEVRIYGCSLDAAQVRTVFNW
jgi:hypothetical protein